MENVAGESSLEGVKPFFMTARLIFEVNSPCARPAYATLILHSRRAENAKARKKADAAGREEMSTTFSRGDFNRVAMQ